MNPRQPSVGISGLPSKPPGMAGPAPPLPSGPPPPQPPYQQQQDAQAAHAAAWAAYYQSQGQTAAAAAFAAPAAAAGAAGTAANPYANYGYSAAASAQHSAHVATPYPSQPGPSQYRPPVQQYQAPSPYNAQQAPAYGQGYQQQYGQQYAQQPQGAYNWAGAAPVPGQPNQPYRPPGQQPYYPQPQQNQSFSPMRPSPSPGPTIGPNRPYQPGNNRLPSGPRPPMGTPPPSSFPPAKRPRFDGPGGGGPPPGPAMQHARPPAPVRPSGINMGQPGFNARPPASNHPSHPSLPSAPIVPTGPAVPSGPSGPGAPSAPRSNTPSIPPITRPPIHLGLNGPPPPLPFGGSMRSGLPGGRGMRGGARGGMMNVPRGPAGMRRQEPPKQARDLDRKRKDKERDRAREKEEKITMTDFRIVGIEVKGLDWAWGLVGGEHEEIKDETKAEEVEGVAKKENVTEVEGKDSESEAVPKVEGQTAEEGGDELKADEVSANAEEGKAEDVEGDDAIKSEAAESLEEKRGEKRKAKTPEIDEASSPKKRSGEYLLTHGKPNETPSASASVHESNQNRFRIYFESPAELDRVPKALRRNPNKRWRRASSSVAPSVAGERKVREGTVATVDEGVEEREEEQEREKQDEPKATDVKDNDAVKDEAPEPAVTADEEVEALVGGAADEETKPENQEAATEVAQTETIAGDTTAEVASEALPPPPAEDQSNAEAPVAAAAEAQGTSDAETKQPTEEVTPAVSAEVEEASFDIGDVSMRTEQGDIVAAIADLVDNAVVTEDNIEAAVSVPKETETNGHAEAEILPADKAADVKEETPSAVPNTTPNLVESAENTASAYKSRTRRRSSVSSAGSADEAMPDIDITTPSTNRVSILYEGSSRRLCIDANAVAKVRIHREEGKIEVVLKALDRGAEGKELPKGVLVEMYDSADQRFVSATAEKLEEMWAETTTQTAPPFQRSPSDEPLVVAVYLNKKRPLSEPKWCRTNSADEWLFEQFGAKRAGIEGGWKGKLEVVDPDPAPTLQSILDSWASSSSAGPPSDRRRFTETLQSDPNDLLEILLRLTRGERNPAAGSSGSGSLGPLATAIRSDSPFASHQTHVSLAILAMYRLTTDYAAKAGEKSEVVNEKISDIIKSLPVGMIHRSLDGLFREWDSK